MSEGLVLMPLAPEGDFDEIAKVQPKYRNTVTGQVAELAELCEVPGAVWHAWWIPEKPYLLRYEDGSIISLPRIAEPIALLLQRA